jgi:GNAT superfamily N-acetyltransferase
VQIAPEPFDAPDSVALRDAMQAEVRERYGGDTEPGAKPSARDVTVFLVARDEDGTPLGCGGLRPVDADTAEIKRMYVAPAARGRGLGALLLAALEDEARALGISRLQLETGPRQPEAIAVYIRAGYAPIPCWGAYATERMSRCYGRTL